MPGTHEAPIPKRIHYCWLSNDPLPELNQRCVDTWRRVMPDYELVRWDMNRVRELNRDFVNEAISVRAWAFAADYIRLHALYHEGGIYLDSDVEVFKPFDRFLEHGAFSAIEHWPEIKAIGIEGAILGARKGNPWIGECLRHYDGRRFLGPDGKKDETIVSGIIADIAAKNFGFKFEVKEQHLEGDVHLYPPVVLTHARGVFSKEETHALHHCVGSWRDDSSRSLLGRIKRRLLRMVR